MVLTCACCVTSSEPGVNAGTNTACGGNARKRLVVLHKLALILVDCPE